jgi:two-component system, OmpR family, phosphate regulon sensor histidine kinase PhoR
VNAHKNKPIQGLIITSIILLIVLQVFWLRAAYEKAYIDYRRDVNQIFRNTVFALRDSIFARNIEPLPYDTLFAKSSVTKRIEFTRKELRDTTTKDTQLRVYISGENHYAGKSENVDSVIRALRPFAMQFQEKDPAGLKSFIVRITPDSIHQDTLRTHFQNALLKGGYTSPFIIRHIQVDSEREERGLSNSFQSGVPFRTSPEATNNHRISFTSDSLHTDFVRLNPAHRYRASLFDIKGFLLREILPQIFFSVFLTLTTLAAFLLLFRNLRAQQRLMEIKNDFINNITHELKTPVATVSVAIEALRNFNGMENPTLTKEYLTIAQNELNRLTMMTDKILKTSVFEQHGISFQQETVNLETIIETVVESFKILAEKQSANITLIKKGSDFTLLGSEAHITNVVFNLLDNALKYSASKEALIQIRLIENPNSLTLEIQDNGIGIPTEYHQKIFEKFFRVPTGDVHNAKGYGLGLSYVQSVVKSHGGKIEVASSHEGGGTFTIQLPK